SNTPVPFDQIPKSAFVFSVPVTVTGVTVSPGDFPENGPFGDVALTPAFFRKYGGRAFVSPELAVRLHSGSERTFQREVNQLSNGGNAEIASVNADISSLQRSIHPQAIALWMFGALAALAGLLVFAQALARQTFLDSGENPTLASLGMTPGQMF